MYIFLHFVTIGTYIFPHLWGTRICFALKATRFVSDVSHFLKMLDLAYQKYPSNYLKLFSIKKTPKNKSVKKLFKK